ncbi:antibiotic biosynthesis monooxygenase family protein [Larkinella sp. VNQ87]|uniref:antibiotic biosynthesis monooxygenase family protein n=1 Tax=Larkinella sp. VNQ87 TaxID=3400921 RepID=UPI003C1068CF
MYARVIQVSLQPDALEKATAYFRDSVGPALKTLDGFKNSRFLTNSSTNKCLMVTLWESEEARHNAETNGFLQNVLAEMKGYFAGAPVIDYYAVAVQVV